MVRTDAGGTGKLDRSITCFYGQSSLTISSLPLVFPKDDPHPYLTSIEFFTNLKEKVVLPYLLKVSIEILKLPIENPISDM